MSWQEIRHFLAVVAHYLMDKTSFDIDHIAREFIRFFLRQGTREHDRQKKSE
jgi:hypothetical protein